MLSASAPSVWITPMRGTTQQRRDWQDSISIIAYFWQCGAYLQRCLEAPPERSAGGSRCPRPCGRWCRSCRRVSCVHLPVPAFWPHYQPLTVTGRKVSAAISRCRRLAGRATAAAARRGPTAPGCSGRPAGQPAWLGRRPSQSPGSRRWGR